MKIDSKELIGWINHLKKNKFSKKFIDEFYFSWKSLEKKLTIKDKNINNKKIEKEVIKTLPKEIIKSLK